jgi:hypothetical protein
MSVIDLTVDSGESDDDFVIRCGSSVGRDRCSSSATRRNKKPKVGVSSLSSAIAENDDQGDDAVMIIDPPKRVRVEVAASKGKM